nr:hypothetical protein CFP56_68668 [Quercus suber]
MHAACPEMRNPRHKVKTVYLITTPTTAVQYCQNSRDNAGIARQMLELTATDDVRSADGKHIHILYPGR